MDFSQKNYGFDILQEEGIKHGDFMDDLLGDRGPDWFELEDIISQAKSPDNSPKYMNNQDYTLNSPMIKDELSEFMVYLKGGTKKHPVFYHRIWEDRVKWIKKVDYNISNLIPIELYHKTCAELWSDENIDFSRITDLIVTSDRSAEETFVILQTYLSSWTGHKIKFLSRSINSKDTLRYGALMLESLILSWILNATTIYELDSLSDSLGLRYLDQKNKKGGVIWESKIFGKCYCGNGIVLIPNLNTIWDRNMLLMFKDTSTARFHTLFAIQHRQFDIYHPKHLQLIEGLYRSGDKVLKYDPVHSYEVFGMIEPISSLRLAELAGSNRPLIPMFKHFHDHVDKKIAELVNMIPVSREFFDQIDSLLDYRALLTIYGSFRHWGHPFIDYMTGLDALYKNVTSTRDVIDESYADLLASDLAFKILKKEFRARSKWFLDASQMEPDNPLREHVVNNTWPSIDVLISYTTGWNHLPITKCWEIPEVVDPSIIYSDKTHSIQKSQLINHLRMFPNRPIPTVKVLDTLIHTKSTNWPEFLDKVNEFGLEEDSLIIGLKAKEREIKWKGRFFSLMSWELREYFVFTEYLIKQKVLPLFRGLTMADDQTTLIRKMIDNTSGQGGRDYKNITIANHIDYEKWNNFQRSESTSPVFRVIGQFFGFANLFSRTHEFFQKSLVYYRDRPDLMKVVDGQVVNRYENMRVTWQGQAGGFEGLRQKGWSVLNLLVIERESRIRNTNVKILAQGDNQVICTQYALNPVHEQGDLIEHLRNVCNNNDVIMDAIRKATRKIGLRINEDETLQAADLLIYGKTILYRGNITCLEEKRYSRITCTTNDQLPSLGNILATVTTNSLTISHYSKSPKNAMVSFNWLGNFVYHILLIHNPALRCSPTKLVSDPKIIRSKLFKICVLYLDPSLGGFSGMSLSRFHIRMFPDPITEGLSFWKVLENVTDQVDIKKLATNCGNPKLSVFKQKQFIRLLEDPSSINIPRGLSAQNLIKDEIKRAMLAQPQNIAHEIIRDAVIYCKSHEEIFINYLLSITPCFPRFLSEFRSASFLGLTNSIIGLFENSKTIRNLFKKKFSDRVDSAIVKCELGAFESLITICKNPMAKPWDCSSKRADELRSRSWGRTIIGTTVPHPLELIQKVTWNGIDCNHCSLPIPSSIHIIVIVPQGMAEPEDTRGPYTPYLGSSTNESTSLIQSWERDTDISFIKKASNLRRVFNWFIDPSGPLGKSIISNLESLIGGTSGEIISGFKRTGSALHRFGCSRVSSGGYVAGNPVYGSRMIISTDHLQLFGDKNFDFMYQSLMLYAQQTVGELHNESPATRTYHFHFSCHGCLREIEEPHLETPMSYNFPDMSQKLSKWKPANVEWLKEPISIVLKEGRWDKVSNFDRSYQVGCLQGVIFGNLRQSYGDTTLLNGLFPIGIRNKVDPKHYMDGLRDGLFRASALDAIHRRAFYQSVSPDIVIQSCYRSQVENLVKFPEFLIFVQGEELVLYLKHQNQRVPPSYPLNNRDLAEMSRANLTSFDFNDWIANCKTEIKPLWIFADFVSVKLSGILILAYDFTQSLKWMKGKDLKSRATVINELISSVKNDELNHNLQNIININEKIHLCKEEVRHAIKTTNESKDKRLKEDLNLLRSQEDVFTNKPSIGVYRWVVNFISKIEDPPEIHVKRIQNPLISGIRVPQIATGSFLKIDAILTRQKENPMDMICGGDGSGGISSLLLRKYQHSRLIFNSLLTMDNVSLGGSLPRPPSAIDYMITEVKNRCVNLENAWEYPMDLSHSTTWDGFLRLKYKYGLKINLGVFDMEIQEEEISDKIDILIREYLSRLFEIRSTLIIKTYLARLFSPKSILCSLGHLFQTVIILQTDISSSQTSEVYVYLHRIRTEDHIRLYPDWNSLSTLRENCFCMRSYSEEFGRARRMLRVDLIEGIPARYLPDFRLELLSIWEDIGGDKLLLQRWYRFFPVRTSSSYIQYFLSSTIILSNQIINTTRWITFNQYQIPSDPDLSKLFSYIIGVGLYVALQTNSQQLGKKFQTMIDKPFDIYLGISKSKGASKQKKIDVCGGSSDMGGSELPIYMMEWSLTKNKNSRFRKTVFVQHKLALIGSVLRVCIALKRETGGDRIGFSWNKLSSINKGWSKEKIKKSTGLLDLLC